MPLTFFNHTAIFPPLSSSGSKFSPGGQFDEEGSDRSGGEAEETEHGGAAAAPGSGAPSGPPPPESPGPTAHPATAGPPPPGPLSPPPPLRGFPMPPPPFPPGQPPAFLGNRGLMGSPPSMMMGLRPPFPPPPMPDLQMLQSLFPFPPPLGHNPMELFSNFLRSQAMSQGGTQSNILL